MNCHPSDILRWTGEVEIEVQSSDPPFVQRWHLSNLIVNDGLNLLAQALRDSSVQPEITWVALGSGSSTPAAGDSQLETEEFRKQVTEQHGSGTGVTVTNCYIAPAEATGFIIREIGWFAGDASATPDSGILVARIAWVRSKSELESIQIERTDTIS